MKFLIAFFNFFKNKKNMNLLQEILNKLNELHTKIDVAISQQNATKLDTVVNDISATATAAAPIVNAVAAVAETIPETQNEVQKIETKIENFFEKAAPIIEESITVAETVIEAVNFTKRNFK
jgi:uncharacterized protein YoxC